jgi:hypothetical protein
MPPAEIFQPALDDIASAAAFTLHCRQRRCAGCITLFSILILFEYFLLHCIATLLTLAFIDD